RPAPSTESTMPVTAAPRPVGGSPCRARASPTMPRITPRIAGTNTRLSTTDTMPSTRLAVACGLLAEEPAPGRSPGEPEGEPGGREVRRRHVLRTRSRLGEAQVVLPLVRHSSPPSPRLARPAAGGPVHPGLK